MSWSRAFVAGMILAGASAACASDFSAHLAAGGIVLGRNDNIEVRAKDLFVSTEEIRARYRFFNKTDQDMTTLVVFPLPDITAPWEVDDYAIPMDDPVNFLGFKAQVDGAPVALEVQQQVLAVGLDRTELLKSLGMPLAPHLATTAAAVRALPPERQTELLGLGILRSEERDLGQGTRPYAHPNWTIRTAYFWTQVFPAKKELVIEHQYKPSVGTSAGTSIGNRYAEQETIEDYRERYCVDREVTVAATQYQRALERSGGGSLMERRIEYFLLTGANWDGPIQDFRLVIDKGKPGNLLSVCGNLTRLSPTQFEFRQADFVPEGSLEVLFLEPSQ